MHKSLSQRQQESLRREKKLEFAAFQAALQESAREHEAQQKAKQHNADAPRDDGSTMRASAAEKRIAAGAARGCPSKVTRENVHSARLREQCREAKQQNRELRVEELLQLRESYQASLEVAQQLCTPEAGPPRYTELETCGNGSCLTNAAAQQGGWSHDGGRAVGMSLRQQLQDFVVQHPDHPRVQALSDQAREDILAPVEPRNTPELDADQCGPLLATIMETPIVVIVDRAALLASNAAPDGPSHGAGTYAYFPHHWHGNITERALQGNLENMPVLLQRPGHFSAVRMSNDVKFNTLACAIVVHCDYQCTLIEAQLGQMA